MKRRRANSEGTLCQEEDDSEMDDSSAETPFRTRGHSNKGKKKARRKFKPSIRGKLEGAALVGGSADVEIVVVGVRKTQSIADLVMHVNNTGTKEGIDIGLEEDKCEILEVRDPAKPPPKTLTIKCTIKREYKSTVMKEEFWPSGIYVRDFRTSRKPAGGTFGDAQETVDPGPG